MIHRVGRAPRSTWLGMLLKHPHEPVTYAGNSVVSRGRRNASTKDMPPTSVIQAAKHEEAGQTQPTGLFHLPGVEPRQAEQPKEAQGSRKNVDVYPGGTSDGGKNVHGMEHSNHEEAYPCQHSG